MSERTDGRRKLFMVWLAAMALTWLIVLPWISRWRPVERHLNLMAERKIDASAMFYTELEERPSDHQRILLESLGIKLPTRLRETKM